MRRLLLMVAAAIVAVPAAAAAGVPECDALTGRAASDAAAVLASEFMYECCDDTISRCLDGHPECRALAVRLARHVCVKAAAGADRNALSRSLEKRAVSVTGPKSAMPSAFKVGSVAGSPTAATTIVVYACARCPFCSKLLPALHREVTAGRLAGRVTLVIRPFPIKSHPNSGEANQALAAAILEGRGWDFLLETYRRFDSFSVAGIPDVAAAAGIDRAAFEKAFQSSDSRGALVDSKKEGLRLGVESTPTLFVDGRRYQSELDLETLVDIVLEVQERGASQPAGLK